MEMDETAADGEKRIGGIPERGWNYIIRKKDKKVSSSTSDVKNNMGSTEEQKPKRRRFGPMPGDEIKITVRPEKGLKLGDTREGSVGKALIKAIRRNHALRDEEITTRILKGTNAIIVSTKREDIAKAVTEIEELEIEGKKHSFKAKVIMEDTVKGVVYRVSKEFTDEELGENFSVRGKYADIEIIEARRIRDTEVVVLTFSGDRLPNQVCLYGQMAHVWEYRPVKQVCFVCMKPGHRSDVCPTPDAKGCRNCGRTHAEGEENCRARCAFCEGEHPTGDKECKKRYKEPTKKVQPKTTDTLTDVSKKKAWAEAQSNIEDFPTLRWVTGQANYPTIEGEKSDKQKISEMEETIRELKKVAEIQREQFQRTMEIQREQFHKMEEQNAKMAETIKRLEGNSWRQEEKHKKELETLRRRCENKTDEPKTQPKPAEAPKKTPKERKGPLEERKEQLDNKFENKFELLESKFEQLENKFEQRFAKIEQMLASLLDGAAGPPRRKCAKDGYESDVSCDEVEKPHLILLQEPNSEANLSGYYVYGNDKNKPRVATLVNKNITVIHHETKQEVENVLTEVVPSNKGGKSTFVLNVYAQHKGYKTEDLAEIMETACKMAGKDNAIVVAGDFNSAHTEWGYVKDTKRGKELLKLIEMHELTIINDTDCHTRVGNSVSRDTNPDLSMIRGATAGWINTQETLGSDHCIIRIEVVADAKRRRIGKNQRTDWRKFRQEVETRPIDDLARWTRELKRAKEDYTNEVELTEKVTAVDSRLETLWKKRRNLTVKWKINKLNRNLRRRVAELNEEIEKYADDLARQNWWQKCDKLQNTLETKQTWNLLKYLADPASTRGETNRTLTRIVHKFQGDVLEYIKNRYVPDQGTPETGNEYTGRTNESLDRDFDVGELVAAAAETTNSTPGRDGITNATLRNLPQKTQKQLTNFINEVWNSGKEERLQKAAEVIQEVAKASGLHCSPEKSEILRIHGRRYDRSIPINVTIEGHTVPEVKELRLLGMWLQHNGKATLQWEKISKTIDIMGRMIKRVTHRKWGLKERDVAKIVQAVVVSRITYCMPYHRITKTEERKIDCKMRGVYKLALGLPITTSTEKLMAMGISNTYGEHKDAMLTAQKERLGRSETGRRLATKLGFNDVRTKATRTADLSDMAKNTYIVRPIPKHMRPDTHEQRRLARARYYERIAKKGEVAYVDAADYPDRDAKVAVYLDKNKMEKNSCSMPRATTEEAEERAIALAMMDGYRKGSSMLILSDSQQACRNFLKGRIGARTAKLINKVTPKSAGVTHEIAWIPAHAGVTGNQAADDRARAHTFRAGLTQPGKTVIVNPSYSELLDHYKACRFQFPEPADRFDRIDAALWRRLQAGNFPNKVLARHVDPDRYEDDSCPWCGSRATLYHSTWECTNNDELPKLQDEEKGQAGWERLLRSRDPGEQLRLLERAKLAGQLLGILE
ncbi:uncharacterized protein ISCGN_011764 [Ixodes scapularis]